jgi:replication-associated recombination protein RarA
MIEIEMYKDYLKMLSNGLIHSVLCYSKAGYGKTYTTIKFLKEIEKEYVYYSGVTTAVALYKILFENNNKIIVLDDIETIFQDDRIIDILKASLWDVDNKRIVSYKSSSKVLENYPDSFEFIGKIIILANEVKGKNDESFKALLSRTLKYHLNYKYEDIKKIAINIINNKEELTQEQKTFIISIINNKIYPEHNFNFRIMERLISFVKYDMNKAEELFMNSIDIDEDIQILIKIINEYKNVDEQIEEYKKITGHSRPTFFRKKKKLKQSGVIE